MRIPTKPPALDQLMKRVVEANPASQLEKLMKAQIGPTVDGRYRHWEKLQYLTPPEGFNHQEWWLAIKMSRSVLYVELPLLDKQGNHFRYALPPQAHEMLHRMDKDASGTIQAPEPVTNPSTRDAYLMRSLLEEAITSSQLEGAATTMQRAKHMILQGRKPRTRDEQMVMNNYNAMLLIRQMKEMPLSPQLIFGLHRILTEKTLENPHAAGRFRRSDEEVFVRDDQGQLLHVPPDAKELGERMRMMCEFANDQRAEPFMHPVIKAILLHFWLAYDHPFVDGNGRTARALYYWAMLRQGYWLSEYLSISKILKKAPAKYGRSFLYCETDDNDTTYFILSQLAVILNALDELYAYLERKTKEIQDTERLLSRSQEFQGRLNHRQLGLITYALKHPATKYTIKGHQARNALSYQTARTDLLGLAHQSLGFLIKRRVGKEFVFDAPADLKERLQRLAGE